MNNGKKLRTALITSAVSLCACVAMLAGSTFAWFTDSVTSGNNTITAGNLDVEFYRGENKTTINDSTTDLFGNVGLWEPGAADYEILTISNAGTLALRYILQIDVTDNDTYKLSSALKIGYIEYDSTTSSIDLTDRDDVIDAITSYSSFTNGLQISGELEAGDDDVSYLVVVYWEPSDDDNNYNISGTDTPAVTFTAKLVATQLASEYDGFDNTYDEDAIYYEADGSIYFGFTSTTNELTGTTTVTDIYGSTYTDNNDGTYTLTSVAADATSIILPAETLLDSTIATALKNSNVTAVTIEEGATSIGDSAFYNCLNITTIEIPETVESIGENAFMNSGITEIEIPSSVTTISSSALRNCDSLTSVTIPSTVTSIGSNLLYGCDSLTTVVVEEGITSIPSSMCLQCASLTDVTIPSTVATIGSSAFNGCTALENITIPENVETIGTQAFQGCSSLKSITIPDSVTSCNSYTFSGCSSLEEVSIGSGLTSIGGQMFRNCTSLTSIVIPDTITAIGAGAFYGCTALADIDIGSGITKIEYSKDTGGTSLVAFGNTAYYNDENNWEDGVLYIGNYLVWADDTVQGCYEVKEGTTLIAGSAFSHYSSGSTGNTENYNLISITIPGTMEYINSAAFYNCKKLVEVCNNSSLTIEAGATSYGYVANNAKHVYSDKSGSSNIVTEGEFIFYNDSGTLNLLKYTGSDNNVTLPTTINGTNQNYVIGDYAFYQDYSLTGITLNDYVTAIGNYAFEYCRGLTSITITKNITSIGTFAFYYCNNLYEVYNLSLLDITAGSTDNGRVAYYAKNVYTDTQGSSVLSYVDNYVIYKQELSGYNIYYLLGYTGNETDLTLPTLTLGEDDIYVVNEYAFYNNTSITSVTIPDGVTTISSSAFYGCTSLVSVNIAGSVTSIGQNAFYGCTSLTNVLVSLEGKTSTSDDKLYISKNAFNGCTSITSVYIKGTSSEYNKYVSVTSEGNTKLTGATRYYYDDKTSGVPTVAGNYWYYDGDTIVTYTISE